MLSVKEGDWQAPEAVLLYPPSQVSRSPQLPQGLLDGDFPWRACDPRRAVGGSCPPPLSAPSTAAPALPQKASLRDLRLLRLPCRAQRLHDGARGAAGRSGGLLALPSPLPHRRSRSAGSDRRRARWPGRGRVPRAQSLSATTSGVPPVRRNLRCAHRRLPRRRRRVGRLVCRRIVVRRGCAVARAGIGWVRRAGGELSGVTRLVHLSLRNNELTGSIPAELGNLTELTTLDLQGNELTGAIPPELASLTNLVVLYLRNNAGFTGCIPLGLGVHHSGSSDLPSLNLPDCGVTYTLTRRRGRTAASTPRPARTPTTPARPPPSRRRPTRATASPRGAATVAGTPRRACSPWTPTRQRPSPSSRRAR